MANLGLLYARAALSGFARRGEELPEGERSARVLVDREHLAEYARVCGFRRRDELPVTYPHVLAFALQVDLMTARGFPFPLPGLVHVANRVTQTRPLLVGEPLELRVRLEELRAHERGRQFDAVTTAEVDGERVWVDVSTYLRRAAGGGGARSGGVLEPPEPNAVWRVPGDVGRRYAAVSGDRNPIHLFGLAARAFGFRRAIAHGMWTKARCVAALEGRIGGAQVVDARFKTPLGLPARAEFSARPTAEGWRFAVWSGGRPVLEGSVSG
ncbi:MaoC family dehydratase [Actinosynnema sp.]|uniref:MaoC family dehydratase n=1 Tax=Actinosynnema sp. TaxID=1872144 RepID=UPI003F83B100